MGKHKVVINLAKMGGLYLSEQAVGWLKAKGLNADRFRFFRGTVSKPEEYGPYWRIPRHDPLLVECIKTLKEEANGPKTDRSPEAFLQVVEITGQYYYIDPHEGNGEEVIDITKMIKIPE